MKWFRLFFAFVFVLNLCGPVVAQGDPAVDALQKDNDKLVERFNKNPRPSPAEMTKNLSDVKDRIADLDKKTQYMDKESVAGLYAGLLFDVRNHLNKKDWCSLYRKLRGPGGPYDSTKSSEAVNVAFAGADAHAKLNCDEKPKGGGIKCPGGRKTIFDCVEKEGLEIQLIGDGVATSHCTLKITDPKTGRSSTAELETLCVSTKTKKPPAPAESASGIKYGVAAAPDALKHLVQTSQSLAASGAYDNVPLPKDKRDHTVTQLAVWKQLEYQSNSPADKITPSTIESDLLKKAKVSKQDLSQEEQKEIEKRVDRIFEAVDLCCKKANETETSKRDDGEPKTPQHPDEPGTSTTTASVTPPKTSAPAHPPVSTTAPPPDTVVLAAVPGQHPTEEICIPPYTVFECQDEQHQDMMTISESTTDCPAVLAAQAAAGPNAVLPNQSLPNQTLPNKGNDDKPHCCIARVEVLNETDQPVVYQLANENQSPRKILSESNHIASGKTATLGELRQREVDIVAYVPGTVGGTTFHYACEGVGEFVVHTKLPGLKTIKITTIECVEPVVVAPPKPSSSTTAKTPTTSAPPTTSSPPTSTPPTTQTPPTSQKPPVSQQTPGTQQAPSSTTSQTASQPKSPGTSENPPKTPSSTDGGDEQHHGGPGGVYVNNPPTSGTPHTAQKPPKQKLGILLERDRNWIPMQRFTQKEEKGTDRTIANAYIYRYDEQAHKWVFPGEPKKITFHISSSSEPGECLNSGNAVSKDIFIEAKNNPHLDCADPKATTKREVVESNVDFSCEDFGAFSRIWATAPQCVPLRQIRHGAEFEVEEAPAGEEQASTGDMVPVYSLTLPADDESKDDIADAYESLVKATPASPDADDETEPEGNKAVVGDGLTAYEEYRGFRCLKVHRRTSWKKKDLFIANPHDFNVSTFAELTGIWCHLISTDEYDDDKLINSKRKTHQRVKQHGVLIVESAQEMSDYETYKPGRHLEPAELVKMDRLGVCGVTLPRDWSKLSGPPKNWIHIVIDQARTERMRYPLNKVVAHELGHSVAIKHHAEGYGQAEIIESTKFPEGGLAGRTETSEFWVNNYPGPASGDWGCVMRYPAFGSSGCPGVFKTPNGIQAADYGYTWSYLCDTVKGTQGNKDDNMAGDCGPGRGDCIHQFFVNDGP